VLCVFKTVKYYFKAEVEFERQVSNTDERQHTTAQFYVTPMISASDPLDIHSVSRLSKIASKPLRAGDLVGT